MADKGDKGGFLLYFVGTVLVLMTLVTGGTLLPLLMAGLFWLYRRTKQKPAPQRPMPAPVAWPEEGARGGDYGASDGSLGFEVPPLAGAPQSAGDGVYREAESAETFTVEASERREKKRARQRRQAVAKRERAVGTSTAAERPAPRLTPAALADAVVLAELLAPPKALRGRRRGL